MTTQPTALRHADKLDAHEFDEPHGAAAELRRLYKLLMDMQGEIYTLGMSRSMEKKMAELSFNALEKQRDAPCHVGLVPQEKCAHCGRIARARAAIKAVEGEKT